jgi:hypothetical protein
LRAPQLEVVEVEDRSVEVVVGRLRAEAVARRPMVVAVARHLKAAGEGEEVAEDPSSNRLML